MEDKVKAGGIWSAIGTLALAVLIAIKAKVFGIVAQELLIVLSGGFKEIASNHTTFLMMFPVILAVVAIELPCSIGAAVIQGKILGKSGRHALSELFKNLGEGNLFFQFFVMVLLEELSARWFFLGFLSQIPFLSGTFGFILLFLAGNGIWSLRHLHNFREKKDHHPLRVLPQFVAGFFFTYIFLKYGLLAVVLTHFASNAILFSLHKIQRTNIVDALLIGYAGLCAIVSYALMNKPLADVLAWFADKPTFSLPGWEFWDYVKVSIFLSSCFAFIFDLLLYDKNDLKQLQEDDKKLGIIGTVVGLAIILGIIYGLYALFGLFIGNVPYRILVLAIIFSFVHRSASGSAMTRTFWVSLPNIYITVCILQVFNFWLAMIYLLTEGIIEWPRTKLLKIDS